MGGPRRGTWHRARLGTGVGVLQHPHDGVGGPGQEPGQEPGVTAAGLLDLLEQVPPQLDDVGPGPPGGQHLVQAAGEGGGGGGDGQEGDLTADEHPAPPADAHHRTALVRVAVLRRAHGGAGGATQRAPGGGGDTTR